MVRKHLPSASSVTLKSHSYWKLAIWQLRKSGFSSLKEINWYLYIVKILPVKQLKEEKSWYRSGHSELIWITTAARWSTYDLDGRVSTVFIPYKRNSNVAQNLQTRTRPLKAKWERPLKSVMCSSETHIIMKWRTVWK